MAARGGPQVEDFSWGTSHLVEDCSENLVGEQVSQPGRFSGSPGWQAGALDRLVPGSPERLAGVLARQAPGILWLTCWHADVPTRCCADNQTIYPLEELLLSEVGVVVAA